MVCLTAAWCAATRALPLVHDAVAPRRVTAATPAQARGRAPMRRAQSGARALVWRRAWPRAQSTWRGAARMRVEATGGTPARSRPRRATAPRRAHPAASGHGQLSRTLALRRRPPCWSIPVEGTCGQRASRAAPRATRGPCGPRGPATAPQRPARAAPWSASRCAYPTGRRTERLATDPSTGGPAPPCA